MASVFKPKGSDKYVIVYRDHSNKRRWKTGTKDKAVSERIGRHLEDKAALRRDGGVDPRDEAYAEHASRPLSEHLEAWKASNRAKGSTAKHVDLFTGRAAKVIAIVRGATLAEIDPPNNAKHADLPKFDQAVTDRVKGACITDLTADRVQKALATLRDEGRSLATCNHHRAAIKAFSAWCYDHHRIREDMLRGVTGFNAKEDRRHDRRAISIEEQRKLIEAAQGGEAVMGVPGPVRSLVYRVAIETGLRYDEIRSIRPESFDWEAPSVTIEAAYTKNGQTAKLKLKSGLATDLAAYVATLEAGDVVFPLPTDKGAKLLRADLEAAGIPYEDASGLFFDFHALRGQLATNADRAGVSPRVVQRLMRHSSLALTDRYTRPRAVDIEGAVDLLPEIASGFDDQEALAATGTDGGAGRDQLVSETVREENVDECNVLSINGLEKTGGGLIIRRSGVRVASPVVTTAPARLRWDSSLASRPSNPVHRFEQVCANVRRSELDMEGVVAVSPSDSTELDRSESHQAREVKATDDIKDFCEKLMIRDDFAKSLSLARLHFSVLGDPWYEIIEDSESQECYVAIHVNTDGSPDEVF